MSASDLSFLIRPVTQADIPFIYELEKENFPGDPWSEALLRLAATHDTTVFLGAFPDDASQNAAVTQTILDADAEQMSPDLPGIAPAAYCIIRTVLGEGSIDNICVSSPHRKRGLAEKLLTETMRQAAEIYGASVFTLEVRVSNAPARALYEKMGFTLEGVRPSYYTHPREDAAIYYFRP